MSRPWRRIARRVVERAATVPVGRGPLRVAAHAGVLPSWVWSDLQLPQHFRVGVGRRSFHYDASPGDRLAAPLYWSGLRSWEAETFSAFVPLARVARGFLDIGAYTGVFTLVAATVNKTLRAMALEPNPLRFETMVRNLERNAVTDRCTPLPVAIGSSGRRARLFVPAHDDSMATIDPRESTVAGRSFEVDVVSPDSVVPAELTVDLVKIDVEGHEGDVLTALLPRLVRDRPALICEFLGPGPHDQAEAVLDRLSYRRWHPGPDGPTPVSHVGGKPSPFHNFLCMPADHPLAPTRAAGA
jgi:FkbM family methyltransferase